MAVRRRKKWTVNFVSAEVDGSVFVVRIRVLHFITRQQVKQLDEVSSEEILCLLVCGTLFQPLLQVEHDKAKTRRKKRNLENTIFQKITNCIWDTIPNKSIVVYI